MNLFELINMRKERFSQIYNRVFGTTNTHDFGDVLIQIRREYSKSSCKVGKNTIGYAMLHMRDEILEDLLPNKFYPKRISEKLFVSSRCYPFEKNPMIANLVGTKTSKKDKESIIELLDSFQMDNICCLQKVFQKSVLDKIYLAINLLIFHLSYVASHIQLYFYLLYKMILNTLF